MSLADRILDPRGAPVRAILGPTNTGKTHRAIQRMLGHRTGMIGLPLRLLAQEVYERVVAERGRDVVALVTGEQKRIPPGARYWVCTVEAMPVDKPVAFLAVDEVQLAGNRNRGHVFTDRLLHARGVLETLFLGSDTIQPLLELLVPHAEVQRYQRLSALQHAGSRKLLSLPPRTAVVDFTAERVYELAERLRARHGGVAVVLGALSPRARNAQVELYQSGQVDHIVATDAIGMGLNMDIHRVAFAALRKFDGHQFRELSIPELGQVAGRAGRHRRDGRFGTVSHLGMLAPEVVAAIEQHRFPALRKLYWRNSDLDMSSLDSLIHSLDRKPPAPCLVQVRDWLDHRCLRQLASQDEVRSLARGREAVSRLWEVCSIPDYRKTRTDSHIQLLGTLGRFLLQSGEIPPDWVASRLDSLDRTDGDIDALMSRISWVRTWNYITAKKGWFADAAPYCIRAGELEDRLSDALHAKLTARFVETRRSHVELQGLRYQGPRRLRSEELRAVHARVEAGVAELLQAEDEELAVDDQARILWAGEPVARLERGSHMTSPRMRMLRNELIEPSQRRVLQSHLERWTRALVDGLLAPLQNPQGLSPAARGLLYSLYRGLGCVRAELVDEQVRSLEPHDRKRLARLGVRLGRGRVYAQPLLSPAAQRLRALLWAVFHRNEVPAAPEVPVVDVQHPAHFYEALGYVALGPRALRVDRAEDLAAYLRRLRRRRRVRPDARVQELTECNQPTALAVMNAMGFRP